MRFFLCPFGEFTLGIPAASTAFLLVYDGEAGDIVKHDEETGDVYFSLPGYFGLPDSEVHHGIVIKEPDGLEDRDRKILLVTKVEKIEDIVPQDIQRLPGILKNMEGSSFFTGICFTRSPPVLFVDPTRFMLRILDSDTVLEEVEEMEDDLL
jgi:hypothetical protein